MLLLQQNCLMDNRLSIMTMKQAFCQTFLLLVLPLCIVAQRPTDRLDRGLVAVPSSGGNFVSWRIFGEEYYDTEYNLYRDGVRLNSTPLRVSNFQDNSGSTGSTYQVAAVVRGVEQQPSAAVGCWGNQYIDVPVKGVTSRDGQDVTSKYELNDVSLADVTGDGVVELIVKRNNHSGDLNQTSNQTCFNFLECYDFKGNRLWWIDLGPNMMAGPDEQWDIVGFDWDGDGKAEMLMRGADNMIIHTASGKTIGIGDMSYDNGAGSSTRSQYTHNGAEYLLYMNGATAEPYDWDGQSACYTPMAYPLPRFEEGESDYATVWGSADTGHRSSKHYFGAPFLDGRHASIFLGRGCYTRHKMCALDVNPLTHELTQRWRWNEYDTGSPWFGNGFHNFAIADVDWDGHDEIVFGSMIIDDNGQGLCTTGLGHGDAQHCADLDPYSHGQEQFTCNEDKPACTYYDATTGKIRYRFITKDDDGRALCANFSNDYPGSMGRSTATGLVSTVADKVVADAPTGTNDALYWGHLNARIYWDGDLLDEVLDSPGTEREAAVYKPFGGRLFTSSGCKMNNSSKNNPGALGDIIGDWREEIVARKSDNTGLRIYTTNIPTAHRLYTLWHDHQYRNAMVWQSVGYNQPPHKSYFVGELEGITIAPPPLTMTGRTEIVNGGSITTAQNNQHVLVCETGDTHIIVGQGAAPYIATFNVPSWVQGTNSKLLGGKSVINYEYYTCTVEGSAFSGKMRLVKQGDGTLVLPAVEQTYTGQTDIWAGTLRFDGQLEQSTLWLNRFASLESDGGTFRSICMDYGAKLIPGAIGHQGTVATDSLLLGFGARVVFDVYADGLKADVVNAKLLRTETKSWVYGPEYQNPVFQFVYHGEQIVPGRYLLGQVEHVEGSLDDILLEGLGTEKKTELVMENGSLYLVISDVRASTSVTWTGSLSSVWDMAATENFADADGGNDFFVSGDNVRFDDTASRFDVELKGALEADSIIVDNTKPYTFTGNGAIVGKSTLVKRGGGLLTIKTDNTYTGGTRISGGAVSVVSLSNENQSTGNLGGLVTAAKFVLENGGELRTTANVTQGSPMRMESEEGGVLNNAANFLMNKTLSGTRLTKRGDGTLQLGTNNPQLQRLVIAAGAVSMMNSSTQPAQTVEFQGGQLTESTTSSYPIYVPEGGAGTWNLANRAKFSNRLTGSGTLTVYCPAVDGGTWMATRTQITGDWSAFEGTINATVHSKDYRFTLDNAYGLPLGMLNIPEGVEVQNTGKTYRIGQLTGKGALGGTADFGSGKAGVNTWQVGNDRDWTFNGRVTADARLVKVGMGKLSWRGANDNTGTTTLREGELNLTTAALLGTGALIIEADATLSGASQALKNTLAMVSGTLMPRSLLSAYSGTLNFGSHDVTVMPTGVLQIAANKCATATTNGCSGIEGVKTLTMNGTVRIVVAANHSLHVGDSIRIWKAQTVTGTPRIESTVQWDTSRLSEGLLILKSLETLDISDVTLLNSNEEMINNKRNGLYDLQGRSMDSSHFNVQRSTLKKGIYIVNGKKIIIK